MASELLHQIQLHGPVPGHVAIIMDGNGRWAERRGLPRTAGHRAGMTAVREVVEGAVEADIETLTLFAFSTENWQRPRTEIAALMGLLKFYAEREMANLRGWGVEVHVLGELDRIDDRTRAAVERVVEATRGGEKLLLNLMLSYSGREDILRAARIAAERVARGELDPGAIDEETFREGLFTWKLSDPDLLIRTSGEYRISNFMLWQLAYTELHIADVLWPDFDREDLFEAIHDYQCRDRRFGRVTAG